MALSSIIRQECKTCKKIAVEESRIKIGKTLIIRLACGHILHSEGISFSNDSSVIFSDGCSPRPYQFEAVSFAEKANVRLIIADEQGLGKTIESLVLFKLHPNELLPAVLVVPTTVKRQWMTEIHRICGSGKEFLTQVIQSSKELALPGFKFYIITYDMLKSDNVFSLLPEGTIKTILIDECQRVKNHLSDRAKAVQKISKDIPHIIAMSGTPIKNHAGEYFTVLNLVAPLRFPHYQRFIDNYCDSYASGWGSKIGGLRDVERFKADTKDIIIRRTKEQVLKDLPSIERKFYHVELDRKLNKVYASALDELEELFYSEDGNSFAAGSAKIAIISKLRHITGISKVTECVDFVTEFLLSCERKIVIFTHHQDVMGMLEANLNEWCSEGNFDKPLVLHAGLDGNKRNDLVEKFKNSSARIMIASTLAAGEGLNLQFCSDAIILERQWNPANENQAESRFHRFGQENNVSITYMLATGTVDELFTEIVERKRAIVSAAMDGKEIVWDQQSLMKELTEALVMRGKKAWSL